MYKFLSSEWRLIRFCGSYLNNLMCRSVSLSAQPPGFAVVRMKIWKDKSLPSCASFFLTCLCLSQCVTQPRRWKLLILPWRNENSDMYFCCELVFVLWNQDLNIWIKVRFLTDSIPHVLQMSKGERLLWLRGVTTLWLVPPCYDNSSYTCEC